MRISDWSSDVCSSDLGENADHMLRVIRNHRRAAYGQRASYEALSTAPVPLQAHDCPDKALVKAAKGAWDKALKLGEKHGFRNAQTTVIAPTGTIGLVMDCDTTGIEPRSEENTSEIQSIMRISYSVF